MLFQYLVAPLAPPNGNLVCPGTLVGNHWHRVFALRRYRIQCYHLFPCNVRSLTRYSLTLSKGPNLFKIDWSHLLRPLYFELLKFEYLFLSISFSWKNSFFEVKIKSTFLHQKNLGEKIKIFRFFKVCSTKKNKRQKRGIFS